MLVFENCHLSLLLGNDDGEFDPLTWEYILHVRRVKIPLPRVQVTPSHQIPLTVSRSKHQR